jgi:hypothetical protein
MFSVGRSARFSRQARDECQSDARRENGFHIDLQKFGFHELLGGDAP